MEIDTAGRIGLVRRGARQVELEKAFLVVGVLSAQMMFPAGQRTMEREGVIARRS
jgi:DNA-binding transcriptional regulator/RsmH inhibitor MraZ